MITFSQFDIRNYANALVVTDVKVASLYGIAGDNVYVLPRGERAKTFANASKLCSWFAERNACKSDLVVAVGGGCVGDVTGFAASVYKRGIRLLHVPTTLVAQIDSAIGGKTALNLDGIKNAVGTFYKADTLIDTRFLQTLSLRQLADGAGELLKYRMLNAEIDALCSAEVLDADKIVRLCARYKQQLCKRDMYDKGVRNRLNFGHTVGHAMELTYGLSHGVAVANGIYYETLLARKLGRVSGEYADKWCQTVRKQFAVSAFTDQAFQLVLQDKKNSGGLIGFVLPPDFVTIRITAQQARDLLLTDAQF